MTKVILVALKTEMVPLYFKKNYDRNNEITQNLPILTLQQRLCVLFRWKYLLFQGNYSKSHSVRVKALSEEVQLFFSAWTTSVGLWTIPET